jgi:hypothetical protein
MLGVFQLLSSPLQLYNQTKLSASGTILDFRALARFYASGCTDMRIWKARVGADQSFRLVLRFGCLMVQECCEQKLRQELEEVSAENGHHLIEKAEAGAESSISFLLSTGRNQNSTHVDAELVLEVSAESTVEAGTASCGTNALVLTKMETLLMQTKNISGPKHLELMDGGALKESKERSPWEMLPETKVYKGKALEKMVVLVGDSEVPGLVPGLRNGERITMTKALERMRESQLRPFLMGGFIRDILMNKSSDDVDLTFACTNGQLLEFAREVDSEGWVHGLRENNQKVTVDQATSPSYINIGDQNKPFALEGKARGAKGVNEAGERVLPYRDFTINEMLYDPNYHELIDPSGRGLEDMRNRYLRVSDAWGGLEVWVHGPSKHRFAHLFRWFKFRGRGYTPADPVQLKWIIDTLTTNIANEAMRKTFKHFFEKEFKAKQQGKSDEESKQAGDKLALRFVTGLIEDFEAVMGQGTDGREWFKKAIIEWLPDHLRAYFKFALEDAGLEDRWIGGNAGGRGSMPVPQEAPPFEKAKQEAEAKEERAKQTAEVEELGAWQVLAELRDHTGYAEWSKNKEGWGALEEHRDPSRCAGVTMESGEITEIDLNSSNLAGGESPI